MTCIKAFGRELEIDEECVPMVLMESKVARRLVQDAINSGHSVSVHDGEEVTVLHSRTTRTVLQAMRSVDEEHLIICRRDAESPSGWARVGSAFFIYGNDGWDVIADYSISLEPIMEIGVNALVERLQVGA